MNEQETRQLHTALAGLVLHGHLAERDADRMAGFLRTVCRIYALDVPEVSVVAAGHAAADIEVSWPSEPLRVRMRANGRASWSASGARWREFNWIADGAEYVVGRGLEVRI